MTRVIVVGCGRSKLDREAPAAELYTGSMFKACRRYAEASGLQWAILSAELGLILPHWEFCPYEKKVTDLSPAEREMWAASAAGKLRLLFGPEVVVECLAGSAYADPLSRALDSFGNTCTRPLAGLGIGLRLRWLKERSS